MIEGAKMIIVLGSQKGGVGKSTLAVSIAAYLMSLGKRVLIVDADDQKSVLTWYNNRPEELPHIPVTGATGNIKAMLKEHEKSYDFVIADCAGQPRTIPIIVIARFPLLNSITFSVGILKTADAKAPITNVLVFPSFCAHHPPNSVNGILKIHAIIVII